MDTLRDGRWFPMLGCAFAAVTALTSTKAAAADSPDAGGNGLQEIVVTAERRTERLQDVPVSVEVLTRDKLDAQAIRGIDDLTRLSPGVTFLRNGAYTTSSGSASDIAIRGIDSIAGAATTALYIDDTPIQARHVNITSQNPYPALFDLDRVEVLRGPQGTLFGGGAEGGAVRFISPEPGLAKTSGYYLSELATTAYGDPSYSVGAAAGGPIIDDKLGFRVSASYRRDGGWVNRVDFATGATVDPRSNYEEIGTLRGALTYAVTENVTVTGSLYYQKQDLNDTGYYWLELSNPAAHQFSNGNAVRSPDADKFYLPAIKVAWNLGTVKLISNTSYFSRDQSSTTDATMLDRAIYLFNGTYPAFPYPPPGVTAPQQNSDKQNNFVEEIRLESAAADSSLNWVAGMFYTHARENTSVSVIDQSLPGEYQSLYGASWDTSIGPLLPGGYLLQTPYAWAVDKQLAGFGQLDWKILESLKLTAGVRVSKSDSSGAQYSAGPEIGPVPATAAGSITEHPVTPKPTRDQLFYASVAKGYRIGGVNSPLSTLCGGALTQLSLSSGPKTYDSDSLWSYEVGAKNSLFDRRLQINTSAFYINWSNIQNNVYLPSCGFSFTANLGKVTSKGADIDILARPIDALDFELTASYTDARYSDSVYAAPGATAALAGKGDYLPVAPWTIVASTEYKPSIPLLTTHNPYVRIDYSVSAKYKSPQEFQDPTTISYDPAPFYQTQATSLSARTGLRWSGFDVSLYGTNLTNTHPVLFDSRYYPPLPLFFDTTWRPRTIGVTATYRY
jgi:outer membrane receptor protein involved in Fe transport